MVDLVIEEGKTYRNAAGHLIFVGRRISSDTFLCVRECHGHCAQEVFKHTGYPNHSGPISDRFKIVEEVTTGETVADKNPQPFSKGYSSVTRDPFRNSFFGKMRQHISRNYTRINDTMCLMYLSGLTGQPVTQHDMDTDGTVLVKHAVKGMLDSFESGQKADVQIVLTSTVVGTHRKFKVHGTFPSFTAAVTKIADEEKFSDQLREMVIRDSKTVEFIYQFVRPQPDGSEVHWCAFLPIVIEGNET